MVYNCPFQTASPAWPTSILFHASSPDRLKDHPVKLNQLAGSGPVPWRQAPTLFNSCISRPDLQPRSPYEVDGLVISDRLIPRERYTPVDFSERLSNGNMKHGPIENFENGNAGDDSPLAYNLVGTIIDILHSTHIGKTSDGGS